MTAIYREHSGEVQALAVAHYRRRPGYWVARVTVRCTVTAQADDMHQTKAKLGTYALLEYLWASSCDVRLFHFTVDVVLKGDYLRFIAKRALDGQDEYKSVTPSDLAQKIQGH